MGISKSPLAYGDVRATFDAAIESSRGLKLTFEKYGDAIRWRYRAGKYRAMTCQQNKEVYPPDHPMHGRSPYDEFEFKLVTGPAKSPPFEILVRRYSIQNLKVEEL